MEKNFFTDNKSFQIYKDWESVIRMLTDEEAGELFKALFSYAAHGEIPAFNSVSVNMAFTIYSQQIERDGKKWERRCEQNSKNIKSRWDKAEASDPDENGEQNNSVEYGRSSSNTKDTDKDKETDRETDKDTDKDTDKEKDKDTDRETAAPQALPRTMGLELSLEEVEHLVSMSDRLTVQRYIIKFHDWQKRTGKTSDKPFVVIKRWIEADSADRSPSRSGRQSADSSASVLDKPSYDLDDWEREALNFF